jgi:sec-independent protein translocase protein TatC
MRKFLRTIRQILLFPFRVLFWPFQRIYTLFKRGFIRIRSFFSEEEEDTPLPDVVARTVERPQDLLVHLDALRKHLIRGTLVLLLTTAISFAFTRQIMGLLASPLDGGIDALQAIDVTESFGVFMRVAFLTGFSLALPYIILELWLFAAPGLKPRARLWGLLAIPAITLFFIAGMLFAYYAMLPTALPFLVDFMGIRTAPRPSTYFPFVTGLMFWIGVTFQFPLVIFVLAGIGLVQPQTLIKQSRLAVVILAVIAAAITPTIDPISMLLVWGPLVFLYFLGVGLALIAQRRRQPRYEVAQPVSKSGGE